MFKTIILKARILWIIFLLVYCWSTVVLPAASDPLAENVVEQPVEVSNKPIKTYFLGVLPASGRQTIKINPPATNVAVTSQSGDTTVRCGDDADIYSCSPGKRLELAYDSVQPLTKFWGENTSEVPVRLQIDVYRAVEAVSENSVTEDRDLLTP